MLCFENLQKGHLLLQSGIFLGYLLERWPLDVEGSCKGGNTPNQKNQGKIILTGMPAAT